MDTINAIDKLGEIITALDKWLKRYPNNKLPNAQKEALAFVVRNIGKMTKDDWNKRSSRFYQPQEHNNPINNFNYLVNQLAIWSIGNSGSGLGIKEDRLYNILEIITEKREVMTSEEESDIMFEKREIIAANIRENLYSQMIPEINKQIDAAQNELRPDIKKIDTILKCKQMFELGAKVAKWENILSKEDSELFRKLNSDNDVLNIMSNIMDSVFKQQNEE